MVSPPVHVAQVPVSSIMIMHEGLLGDCVRTPFLLKEHYISKRPLLLIYDFLLLQPISMQLDMFNIVIAPYFNFDSRLFHIHEKLSLAVYFQTSFRLKNFLSIAQVAPYAVDNTSVVAWTNNAGILVWRWECRCEAVGHKKNMPPNTILVLYINRVSHEVIVTRKP